MKSGLNEVEIVLASIENKVGPDKSGPTFKTSQFLGSLSNFVDLSSCHFSQLTAEEDEAE